MLDSIAQAVVGLDLLGTVTYWNAAAERCFGWSVQEAVGSQIDDLVAQDFTQADAESMFAHLVSGKSWQGERVLVHRDGTRFPGLLVQNGIYSSTGELLGIVGITTDLTETKAAQRAREHAEAELHRANAERLAAVEHRVAEDARWQAILAQSADGAIVVDADAFTITFASPAVTTLFGWTTPQLIGRCAADLVYPDDRREVTKALEILGRDRTARPVVEFRLLCSDGSYLWVEAAMSRPFLDGVSLGLVGNLRDITERRHAHQERHQREQLMRALAEKASDVALVMDRNGYVKYANRSASRLVVGAEGDNWGLEGFSHIHPDDRERFDEAMKGLHEPGGSVTVTHRRRSVDGEWRWCEQRITNCLDDPDIQGIIVNLHDIHDRVEVERALRDSETRYRMIAETAQEGIVVTDLTGKIVFANRMLEEIFGIDPAETYRLGVYDLYPPAVHAEVGRLRDEIYARGHHQFSFPLARRDGRERVLRISASCMSDDTGVVGILSMVSDVTDQVAAAADLQYRAFHDPLTGLGNRALLVDRLRSPSNAKSRPVSVLLADIDQFKLVNDSMGHASGDDLLVAVSQRWRQVLRPSDLLARIGGDEFVVVCEDCDEDDAADVAARLHQALASPIEIAGRLVAVRASLGIAMRQPGTGLSADTLLAHADAAMYEAKRLGRGRTALFTSELIQQAETRLQLMNDLEVAIESGQLELRYQPIVDLGDGRLRGIEALCRWNSPGRGSVAPDVFIPVAEETGLIEQLDHWALRQACRDAAALRADGTLPHGAYVTVNCSAQNLCQPDFEQTVCDALAEAGIAANDLVLEVTESAVMRDPDRACAIFQRLRDLGVHVAIDDFGTGHSSLAYLRRFPIDILKVDRSFVSGITTNHNDWSIVSTIIDLAHALGISTVCEGIESCEELALLRRTGCPAGQGWLWSRALPIGELAALVATHRDGFAVDPTRLGSAELAPASPTQQVVPPRHPSRTEATKTQGPQAGSRALR
jgi:diguanylate cyclase (GGDEF)-like protein/PAS domain S-box-containing protein